MKKTIKAILCITLCSVMLLSLGACGGDKKAAGTSEDEKNAWTKGIVGEWENSEGGIIFRFTFYPDGTGKFYENISGRTYYHDLTWESENPDIINATLDDGSKRKFTYTESYILGSFGTFFYKKG